MAGTQELDRLLEELRMTSMNLSSNLPQTATSPRVYNGNHYTSRYNQQTRSIHSPRSTSVVTPYSNRTERVFKSNATTHSSYFQSNSSLHQPVGNRHQSTFNTVLSQRPPTAPIKQYNQIELTIDPDWGMGTETLRSNISETMMSREQRLEAELNSARHELAQLRRAMSLAEQRQRHTSQHELSASFSPLKVNRPPSPAAATNALSAHSQYLSRSINQFETQQQQYGTRSASTFQRSYSRQELPYGNGYPINKRSISHTNVYAAAPSSTTRSWNLRSSNQGSESDLSIRRFNSTSNTMGTSTYSARRERLRQERENELYRQQQQQQRMRQMASSSLGLHEHQSRQQQQQQQQQRQDHRYRSLSAVNQPIGGASTVKEIETIILQPIGRGVHDIDSKVGSMTALHQPTGGSLMDGLHRTHTDGMTEGLGRRGYSSTQFLNRTPSSSQVIRPSPVHRSQLIHDPLTPSQPMRTDSNLMQHRPTSPPFGSNNLNNNVTSTVVLPIKTSTPTRTQPIGSWTEEQTNKSQTTFTHESNGITADLVRETAPYWYQPNLKREEAISLLRDQAPGNFLIRKSTTYAQSYGLAVKVARLPPKVTQKTDDLQSELVRHYLIEVVRSPTKGVRLKGFEDEPVFPSLADLILQHAIDPLALPCRLILPSNRSKSGAQQLPALVVGDLAQSNVELKDINHGTIKIPTTSELGIMGDGVNNNDHLCGAGIHPAQNRGGGGPIVSSTVPFVCVVRDSPSPQNTSTDNDECSTFRCFMLGFVESPQWTPDVCFARAVEQLVPSKELKSSDCDSGATPVRYTEVELMISPHDGITITDLELRVFLRRHLPTDTILYSDLEHRQKSFSHPNHTRSGLANPKLFGIVVRKGNSECTTYVFSECDPSNPATSIIRKIRSICRQRR